MTKPVIAFDCDDVIVATGALFIAHYNELHGTDVQLKDFYSKDYEHVWQTDKETAITDLFSYILSDAYDDIAPMDGAIETLQRLKDSYTLHIVTGRPDETEQATHNWVDKYLPSIFDSIVFTNFFKLDDSKGAQRSKADVCKELGAQWLVDDHAHHIRTVAKQGITGILFGDSPWEQIDDSSPYIVKVKTWAELGHYFSNIET